MKLTEKLFRYIYRAVSSDPMAFSGISIAHPSGVVVKVADQVITVATASGQYTGDLSALTLQGLVTALNASSAGVAATLTAIGSGGFGAVVLLDGDTTALTVTVYGYNSLAWVILDALARELTTARTAISDMLTQLRLDLATDEWLDIWQGYTIGGSRLVAETDAQLRARILATILTLKCNNLALQAIVLKATGLVVSVEDIAWRKPDGTVDQAVIARYNLNLLADGRPAWGVPANNNVLQAAFAVVFSQLVTNAQRDTVLGHVNAAKQGGTQPLAYRAGLLLHTNVSGENSNDPLYLAGPFTTLVPF